MKKSIGIFDSGLGGLTVLKVLAQKFPNESFCYLGDVARLPYGNKSPETIKRYGLEILNFLKKQDVKAVVIACNSASTVFLEQDEFEGVPLLNVIGPGAQAALNSTTDNKIAVLGTTATIRSNAYSKVIKKINPLVKVIEIACPLLVPLVEEGMIEDPITQMAIERYVGPITQKKISTVILGCTHYPMLRPDFYKVLGQKINLVESGEVLAQKLSELFISKKISPSSEGNTRQIRVCITDVTDHFNRLATSLMFPERLHTLEKVTL